MRPPRSIATAILTLGSILALAGGCSHLEGGSSSAAQAPVAQHPQVIIQGIDGTVMAGELLNGSITVDSGQGELTLLTDHVNSITLAQDVDKLDSTSIKVSGKVKDTKFFLKNEHGVLTLSKDRLRKIDFVSNQSTAVAGASGASPTVKAIASPAKQP